MAQFVIFIIHLDMRLKLTTSLVFLFIFGSVMVEATFYPQPLGQYQNRQSVGLPVWPQNKKAVQMAPKSQKVSYVVGADATGTGGMSTYGKNGDGYAYGGNGNIKGAAPNMGSGNVVGVGGNGVGIGASGTLSAGSNAIAYGGSGTA